MKDYNKIYIEINYKKGLYTFDMIVLSICVATSNYYEHFNISNLGLFN
jgi:hypothetical protein